MRFTTALLPVLLAIVVSGDPLFFPRDPQACSCPALDAAFYPVASSISGTSGGLLTCYYPALSRCQYSVSDGSLVKDTDSGLCPSAAPGQTCPSSDAGGYLLGPGSGVQGSILYCTYPTVTELVSQVYSCSYSATTGALTADFDDGFCPTVADGCSAGGPPVSSTATTVTSRGPASTIGPSNIPSVTTFSPSSSAPSPKASTLTVGTTSNPALASSSATITSVSSGPTRTNPVSAVAVGGAISATVLFATLFIQILL